MTRLQLVAPQNTEFLLQEIINRLTDRKAEDISVINLAGKSVIADYMVVATGTNSRHVAALAGHVDDVLNINGRKPLSIEGVEEGNWALIDNPEVIVHVFLPEARETYQLEKMWEDIEAPSQPKKINLAEMQRPLEIA